MVPLPDAGLGKASLLLDYLSREWADSFCPPSPNAPHPQLLSIYDQWNKCLSGSEVKLQPHTFMAPPCLAPGFEFDSPA